MLQGPIFWFNHCKAKGHKATPVRFHTLKCEAGRMVCSFVRALLIRRKLAEIFAGNHGSCTDQPSRSEHRHRGGAWSCSTQALSFGSFSPKRNTSRRQTNLLLLQVLCDFSATMLRLSCLHALSPPSVTFTVTLLLTAQPRRTPYEYSRSPPTWVGDSERQEAAFDPKTAADCRRPPPSESFAYRTYTQDTEMQKKSGNHIYWLSMDSFEFFVRVPDALGNCVPLEHLEGHGLCRFNGPLYFPAVCFVQKNSLDGGLDSFFADLHVQGLGCRAQRSRNRA